MSRLDRGRAHDVLRTDWRDLPPKQREQAFLDALEQCIEDDPNTRPIRQPAIPQRLNPSLHTVYMALAVWCCAGPIIRVLIQLGNGQRLDLLPFITAALGVAAIIVFLRTPQHRDGP